MSACSFRHWSILALAALAGACSTGPVVPSNAEPPNPPPVDPATSGDVVADAASSNGPGSAAPKPDGERGEELLFDEVLAIVDSDVVTRSAVREDVALEVQARLDALQKSAPADGSGAVAKIPPSELVAIERRFVQDRVRDMLLSDSIDALGLDPKQIDQTVARILEERIAEDERKAGGSLQFLERLEERGKTYESYRAEKRVELRRQLSISEKLRNAAAGSQLLATPRDMLDYYEENKRKFTTSPTATLDLLRFDGTERDATEGDVDPAERAATAKRRLEKGEAAATVAEELGATHRRIDGLVSDGSALEILRDFAFAPTSRIGAVSKPIPRGSELWLLRLADRKAGGVRPFEDEAVQREIRAALSATRSNELYLELFVEQQRRTRIWPPDLYRRD